MEVCLVEVNWMLLCGFGLLLANIICSIIAAMVDSKVRKELVKQNQLIREQNDMILKQNGQLDTVIVRVCSKSVHDQKVQRKAEGDNEINV